MYHKLLLLFFVACICLPVTANGTKRIEPEYYSFANDPVIKWARLMKDSGQWLLLVRAQFMNAFLFNTGVVAEIIDLPQVGGGKPITRIVLLRQRINPDGDPDIFMPVTKRIDIVMRPSTSIRNVILIDARTREIKAKDKDRKALASLGARLFDVTLAGNAGDVEAGELRINAIDLTKTRTYPILENLELQRDAKSGAYTFEFDVIAPKNTDGRPPKIHIRESPIRSEKDIVHDWIIISFSGIHRPRGESEKRQYQRFRIISDSQAQPGKNIVFVNPVAQPQKLAPTSPFTVFRARKKDRERAG
jgi:hypothetical protein